MHLNTRSQYIFGKTIKKEKEMRIKRKNNHRKRIMKRRGAEYYPHFRIYFKSRRHPALITREHSPDEYEYRKVMHSERDGRHLNERIFPNPNRTDPNPMYIAKRKRHDEKNNFSRNKLPWRYMPPKK
jgi:hypothetical protein